jgi:hypothetical protein
VVISHETVFVIQSLNEILVLAAVQDLFPFGNRERSTKKTIEQVPMIVDGKITQKLVNAPKLATEISVTDSLDFSDRSFERFLVQGFRPFR